MNTELLGNALQIILMVALSYPLGKHIAKVYKGEKNLMDFMAPVEKWIYKLSGIDPTEEMGWKRFLKIFLTLNLFWFIYGIILLVTQKWFPLNPDHNPNQTPDLAFNTIISFISNTNIQDYSGESGMTYFTQLYMVMFFQFVSAAVGMAALAGVMKAIASKTSKTIGNFWYYMVRTITRILLPLSIVVSLFLILQGMPMTFHGKMHLKTLEGTEQVISQGPVAAIVSIKQLGTNGGGFYGVNSTHPLENPNYLTNIVESVSILLIPMALIFALGFYLKKRKLSFIIFGVMLFAFIVATGIMVHEEMKGNPRIAALGISQHYGAMEGKEVRLGAGATALWGSAATVTSNGSTNGMFDSMMPISGATAMLNMQINSWFGGVGVGFLNYYAFIIIAVFISGMMIGRTPEFLGKKVEAKEMKIATLVVLLHPLLILLGTAISSFLYVHAPALVAKDGGWIGNPGYHGLTEMFYQFTSGSANNGSGMAGLGANNPFWNGSVGLVMILGRFFPIIGSVAIAGLLAEKKFIPSSAGTLEVDTVTFGVMTFAVISIIAALSFFPAHALSTIAEYLTK